MESSATLRGRTATAIESRAHGTARRRRGMAAPVVAAPMAAARSSDDIDRRLARAVTAAVVVETAVWRAMTGLGTSPTRTPTGVCITKMEAPAAGVGVRSCMLSRVWS